MQDNPKHMTGALTKGLASWPHMHLWQIQPLRDTLVFCGILGILYLGYILSIVTVPLLLALTLAYLFEPLVQRMTRSGRVGRARVAVSIISLSLILVAVPMAIGVGYSVIQGIRYTKQVVKSINAVSASVRQPGDETLRVHVMGRSNTWLWVRDYIVKERAKVVASEGRSARPGVPGQVNDAAHPDPGERPPAAPDFLNSDQSSTSTPQPAATPTPPVILFADDTYILMGPPLPLSAATLARIQASGEVTPPLMPLILSDADEPSDLFRVIELIGDNIEEHASEISKNIFQAGGGALAAVLALLVYLTKILATVGLTAFFFFFFCTGYGRVLQFWEQLLPERKKGRALELFQQMDLVISGFIRGRLTICAVMIGLYTLGYSFLGVPAPWIVGPIVGLLTLIPYASGIAAPIAIVLMLLEPGEGVRGAWWWMIGGPLVLLGISQFIDDYILTPRIQGKKTNMDMPTILFASIAGGSLAGFYGLLLAIPIAACIKILLRELFWPRFRAWAMGRADDFLPIPKE